MNKNAIIIDFVLTYHWFDLIKAGKKRNEYRRMHVWQNRIGRKLAKHYAENLPLILRLRRGYTKNFMLFNVTRYGLVNGLKTDLKIDETVYDFKLGELIDSNVNAKL